MLVDCMILAAAIQAAPLLPENAIARFGHLSYHQSSSIYASELSRDGKFLATLAARSATIWNVDTGIAVRRFFLDSPTSISCEPTLAFSHDGSRIACALTSRLTTIWEVHSGKVVQRITCDYRSTAPTFCRFMSNDELVLQRGDLLQWINVDTGKVRRSLSNVRINELSPNGETYLVLDDKKTRIGIGNVQDGRIIHWLPVVTSSDRERRGILFCPDGNNLIVARNLVDDGKSAGSNAKVECWDYKSGEKKKDLSTASSISSLARRQFALSPNKKVLYFLNGEGRIQRIELETGRALSPMSLTGFGVTKIHSHPDGRKLIVVGDRGFQTFDVDEQFDSNNRQANRVHAVFAADCTYGAIQTHSTYAQLLNLVDQRIIHKVGLASMRSVLAFSSDHSMLAVRRGQGIELLAVPSLGHLKTIEPPGLRSAILTTRFSPDDRYLAFIDEHFKLSILEAGTGKVICSQSGIINVLFIPNGKKVLTVGMSDEICLRDCANGNVLYRVKRPKDDGSQFARFVNGRGAILSPDGKTLAINLRDEKYNEQVCLMDAGRGMERARITQSRADEAEWWTVRNIPSPTFGCSLAFSPDSKWLAVGGDDGSIRIWEAATCKVLGRLHGHDTPCVFVGFASDGRKIVSYDGQEGFLWDLRPKGKGNVDDAWSALLSDDGKIVFRAQWSLIRNRPSRSFWLEKLPAARFDVSTAKVNELIAGLDSARFSVREAASGKLAELEGIVESRLREAKKNGVSIESERRIDELLGVLNNRCSTRQLRSRRVVQVLELQGDDNAEAILKAWSNGTEGLCLTEEAKNALARLKLRQTPSFPK